MPQNRFTASIRRQRFLVGHRKCGWVGGGWGGGPQQRQCAGQHFFLIITIKADKRAAKVEFSPSSGAERGSVWGSHSNSRISPMGGEGDYSASQLGAVCMSAPLSWWLLRRGSTQLPSPRDAGGKYCAAQIFIGIYVIHGNRPVHVLAV